MCGIAGLIILDGSGADPAVLDAMSAALVHRGPDASGMVVDRTVGFAFRRLAILDLSANAGQPMTTPDRRHILVFNGEIYNHCDLRARLDREGAAPPQGWRTSSDTETLLHACVAWGVATACRAANGMFAFALWDRKVQRLTLARDRFGKKPLFFARHDRHGLAFASELRALRAAWPMLERTPSIDRRRLGTFLCYGFAPGHETLQAGVDRLAPGHLLEIDTGGGLAALAAAESRPFYDFDFAPRAADAPAMGERATGPQAGGFQRGTAARIGGEAEAVATLHDLLKDAVRLRLLSDVPFGAFLSGGLDSSLVVALMAQLHPEPIKTYTVTFDTGFSEGGYAAEVARLLATEHHELRVSADDLVSAIPAALWSRESPISEPSDIPVFLLSALARRKVTVVLSGEGADEAFAGYPKYAATAAAERWPFRAILQLPWVRPGLCLAARNLPVSLRRVQTALQALAQPDRMEQHAAWFGAFNLRERRELLTPGLWAESEALVHGAAECLLSGRGAPSAAFPGVVEEALYLDTRQWLPADLLLRGDRMTMAHSLELRCPFLDWRVVEFAARRLPLRMKVRGAHVKRIVRKVAEGPLRLPRPIVHRAKWGFKVPIGDWFRGDVLGASLRATLFAPEARARGWYQETAVRRLVDDHMQGRANHSRKLWILYQIELWHRMFVDGSLAPTDALPR